MKIILTLNFATNNFLFTEGDTLRDSMLQWINNEDLSLNQTSDLLDVMSGTGLNEKDLEQLGIPSREVVPFDIKRLYNIANAGYDKMFLNEDWILDYNSASGFKFCPFCYSFKSGGRRFYVLNVAGRNIILSNYNKSWTIIPLKHPGDKVSRYVPVNKE